MGTGSELELWKPQAWRRDIGWQGSNEPHIWKIFCSLHNFPLQYMLFISVYLCIMQPFFLQMKSLPLLVFRWLLSPDSPRALAAPLGVESWCCHKDLALRAIDLSSLPSSTFISFVVLGKPLTCQCFNFLFCSYEEYSNKYKWYNRLGINEQPFCTPTPFPLHFARTLVWQNPRDTLQDRSTGRFRHPRGFLAPLSLMGLGGPLPTNQSTQHCLPSFVQETMKQI